MKNHDEVIEKLLEEHLGNVYSFVYRLVGSAEEAEDIAQETFVKAWKNLKRFREGANMKTWLFAIARNTAIDYLRKKKSLSFTQMSDPEGDEYEHSIADTSPGAAAAFDAALAADKVDAAMDILPVIYKEILTLHYREELTLEEAAQTLDIPLNTAKSRDRRALAALRKLLAPEKP